MSDDVTADQVSEDATHKGIRGEMFPSGHSRHADRRSKSVDAELGQFIGIFGSYYSCERPGSDRVARWEAVRECACTVGPESAGTVSFVGTLSVRRQFQRFCDESGINDGFCSQSPRFREMLIMFPSANNVESSAFRKRCVGRTKQGDVVARINSGLIDAQLLLRSRIVVDCDRRGAREGH